MSDVLSAKIEAARKKAEQAKARLAALEAQASKHARKLDTRRKIILGGLLLDAAETDDRFARALTSLMSRITRDQDRKAFEGWHPTTAISQNSSERPLAGEEADQTPS